MKKILSIITLSAGIIAMSSCSDFLDQTSPSEQTDETVWNSVFYTGTRVNKLYGALGQDRTYSQDLSIVFANCFFVFKLIKLPLFETA